MSAYEGGVKTVDDHQERTFKAGFDFARRLRKSDFIKFLKASGWQSGDHVFMTVDDEPVIDVVCRLSLHATGGRAIIAIADDNHQFGFKLLIAERFRRRQFWRRAERITLGRGANIGMLYSLLSPAGMYLPSEWTRELRFEKVDA